MSFIRTDVFIPPTRADFERSILNFIAHDLSSFVSQMDDRLLPVLFHLVVLELYSSPSSTLNCITGFSRAAFLPDEVRCRLTYAVCCFNRP